MLSSTTSYLLLFILTLSRFEGGTSIKQRTLNSMNDQERDSVIWSAPQSLKATGGVPLPRVARFATATTMGSKVLVAGNDLSDVNGQVVVQRFGKLSLIEESPDGFFRLLPAPLGRHQFIMPQLAATGDGRIHMLWGEDSDNPSDSQADWLSARVNQVWASTLENGRGWSAPRMLYKGDVKWGKDKFGTIAHVGDRLALAVASYGAVPAPGIILLAYSRGEWSVDTLRLESSARPAYLSTAFSGNGIHIAFVAGAYGVGPDQNSVWTVQRISNGSWAKPSLVKLSKGEPATYVFAFSSPAGRPGLIWRQEGVRGAQILQTQMLGTEKWTTPVERDLPGFFMNPTAVISTDGTIHLAYDNRDRANKTTLNYLAWNGKWTSPVGLFEGIAATDPVLVASKHNVVSMMFLGRSMDDATGTPLKSMISRLSK